MDLQHIGVFAISWLWLYSGVLQPDARAQVCLSAKSDACELRQEAPTRTEGNDVFNRTIQRLEQTYAVRRLSHVERWGWREVDYKRGSQPSEPVGWFVNRLAVSTSIGVSQSEEVRQTLAPRHMLCLWFRRDWLLLVVKAGGSLGGAHCSNERCRDSTVARAPLHACVLQEQGFATSSLNLIWLHLGSEGRVPTRVGGR